MPKAAEGTAVAPAAPVAAAPAQAAAAAAAAAAPGLGERQSTEDTRTRGKEDFLEAPFSLGLWSLPCWEFGHQ